jgi:O-succinylhomoserine sulfhydrylase
MTDLKATHPLHRETLAVREAVARSQYGENSEALYLTSGYVQPSAAAAAARFAGDEEGFTYGRYGNPTVASFEKRLAAMEGAEACISTASGMSAIFDDVHGLAEVGRPCGVFAVHVWLHHQADRL